MVKSITSFSRSGLMDWLAQRVSAVILGTYAVVLVGFLLFNPDLTYDQWQGLFGQFWFKIYTLAALIALVAHIWVGMWTVATDYVKNAMGRFIVLSVIALTNFSYFIIGFSAVWGA